jgi:type IV pilus assembly protein PilX
MGSACDRRDARQRGVVLFIALIVLVVMSLAGIALMRGVTSGLLLAGNLGFKRAASAAGDLGIDQAIRAMEAATFDTTQRAGAATWYYADWTLDPVRDIDWSPGSRSVATAAPGGNEVTYIVQRMCEAEGAPTTDTCLLSSGGGGNSTQRGAIVGEKPLGGAQATFYRVTARVVGPKNTVSYVQAVFN